MKKVVVSLVLASLVSSAVQANSFTDSLTNMSASASTTFKEYPKLIGGVATGVFLIAGTVYAAKKYPEGRVANGLRTLHIMSALDAVEGDGTGEPLLDGAKGISDAPEDDVTKSTEDAPAEEEDAPAEEEDAPEAEEDTK